MDQLASMRAFVRIVETGSFTQASDSLGLPKATVSKLIQSLEAHLRTRLLNRTTRRLIVTSDGAAYYERAVQLLADLEELDGSMAVSQLRPKGRLRIDVSPTLAQLVIIPALAEFLAQYPDIQIDIGASERPADLVAENVDCVIRGGNLVDPSLIARRIADLAMLTCAAPSYLERHGVPAHPSELETGHTVVNYFSPGTGRVLPFDFLKDSETLTVQGRHAIAFNDSATYLVGALAGLGIVQLSRLAAREHLDARRLVSVLDDWSVSSISLYVVYPPNRHLSNRLRVFVDWVAGLFATRARIDGWS